MKIAHFAVALCLAAVASPVHATFKLSLQPTPVHPGQPVFLRMDDRDGCFEWDGYTVQRTGSLVTLKITASDHVLTPCLAPHVTPIHFPLGSFEAGSYTVHGYICTNFPVDPCGQPDAFALEVGGDRRRATAIPATGSAALLLLASLLLACAMVRSSASVRRR